MSVGLVIDNHLKSLLSSNCFINIKIRMIGFEGCFKNSEFDGVFFITTLPWAIVWFWHTNQIQIQSTSHCLFWNNVVRDNCIVYNSFFRRLLIVCQHISGIESIFVLLVDKTKQLVTATSRVHRDKKHAKFRLHLQLVQAQPSAVLTSHEHTADAWKKK